MAAIKALQQWCKIQCDGYRDVAITNMTTSFRDGLAFCALIHKYRPDLIKYESLSKENVYDNNDLAFRVADEQLGIPALLDAEDMVALSIPDRLSILTYVSQYYNYFNGRSPIGGMGGIKRPTEGSKEEPSEKKNLPVVAKTFNPKTAIENRPPSAVTQKTATENRLPSIHTSPKLNRAPDQKTVLVERSNKTGTLNSKCAVCRSHVHLVQRHLVDGKLYHRSCFKCSECSGLLLAGAYKAGPEPGTFVCTTHQSAQKGCKPSPSTPVLKHGPATAAEVAPKSDRTQPTTRPTSVLSTPVKVGSKPADPAPAQQPWTASAQRTQAARQRFFQSPAPAPEGPPSHRQQSAPTEAATARISTALKPEDEKGRARALITKQLAEGNCNNNNITYHSGLRTANRFGARLHSAEAPSWRQEKHGQGTAGVKAGQPSPTPATTTTSNANNKESLWLSAISKERARPPSTFASSAKAKAPAGCGASSDWRSNLKPAPNGPGLKTPDSAEDTSFTPERNTSDITTKAHLNGTINSASPQIALASNISGPAHFKAPKQPQQGSGGWGSKNGSYSSTCSPSDWTPVVSINFSPSEPSNHKASSPKQPRRASQGWGSKHGSFSCSPTSDWKPVASINFSPSEATNHKAPSQAQTQQGSGGWGSKNGTYSSTCLIQLVSNQKDTINSPPSEPSNHKAPSSAPQPCRVSAEWGSKNGRHSSSGSPSHQTPVFSISLSPSQPSNHKAPSPKQARRGSEKHGSKTGNYSSSMNVSMSVTRSPSIKSHHIPMEQITKELEEIEDNLNDLEREGVDLEKRLRSYEDEGRGDILMDPLMVDWFNLIRKKQGYVRMESELVYIAKTQDLEEQQPGVEGELRRLMNKPEHLKSRMERRQEAELMDRLVEIVNDRNAIVEGLDQDRLREEEEDQQLNEMMQNLGVRKSKSKRKSSIKKLFRRRSKKATME